MEIASAIALVDTIVYRPGWKFTARDHSKRFEGTICVRVDYVAQETAREQAAKGYPVDNTPYAEFPIIVRDLDTNGLYGEIMKMILEIESHEAREYFRVAPTFWAPFHPHRIDGMKQWAEQEATVNVRPDLQFGLS